MIVGCGSSGGGSSAPGPVAPVVQAGPAGASIVKHAGRRLRLPAKLPNRQLTVPILMYHRVDQITPGLPSVTVGLTVTPSDFSAQMRWLVAHHYHAIHQAQLFAALMYGTPLPRRPVLITFDDGYADIVAAARIMHSVRLVGTAYLITDRLSAVPGFLTWPQVRELERLGFDIGSHTVSHRELPYLSDHAADVQLVRSKGILERRLRHPVQWFAYPAGAFDQRSIGLVQHAGYVLAVTTRPGTLQDAQQPLSLYRLRVLDSTGSSLAGLLPT